jgi:acid phosphatase family membrane protein YuiD
MEGVVKWQYIIVIALGWIFAQAIKILIFVINNLSKRGAQQLQSRNLGQKLWHELWASGGMPSAHTSVVIALALYIGLINGFSSAVFGVALAFATVVIYDAVKVRYAVGQQALTINRILKSTNNSREIIAPVAVVKGHTVLEALGGFFVGIVVGLGIYWLL